MAQAIRSGRAHVSRQSAAISANPNLTCSPAPCVLPNAQASGNGGSVVNEVPITANPINAQQLLTGGNDFNCGSIQGFYASSDGGTTWNHTCLGNLPGSGGCGDPAVGYDLHGTAFITGVDCGSTPWYVAFAKSTDNGATWSAPTVAVNALFQNGFTDKEWLQVDDNPTSPYANNIYISVTQYENGSGNGNDEISVTHSSDGGATWNTVAVDSEQFYPKDDQFSDLAIGKDGTVYVTWERCTANGPTGDCGGTTASFWISKSTDGGNTWSAATQIATANLAPDTCGAYYGCLPNTSARLTDIPSVGIDNSAGANAGHLYVTLYNWTGSFMQVEVMTSSDGGSTWSQPVLLTPVTDIHDQFFPWLSVSAKGTVGVTWLDRRNDPGNLSYEAFAAVSSNGGKSFGKNYLIASQASNPKNDGFGGGFLGDYRTSIWSGSTLYASWMDTRNGSNSQDEVGGFRCRMKNKGDQKQTGC